MNHTLGAFVFGSGNVANAAQVSCSGSSSSPESDQQTFRQPLVSGVFYGVLFASLSRNQIAICKRRFLTPDWTPQCTHLLLEQFAITPKLLCCIIDGACLGIYLCCLRS